MFSAAKVALFHQYRKGKTIILSMVSPIPSGGKTSPGQSRNHGFTIHLTAKQQAEKQDNGGMWKAFVWGGRRHHNAKA